MVTRQKHAKGLGRQGNLIHIPAQSLRHAGRREVRWERIMHGSFPGFFTSACEVLALLCCTRARPPPKENRKNQIKEPGHFPFPKSSLRPILKHVNEATLGYSLSNVYYPLKSNEVLPLTRPSPVHHHCCGAQTLGNNLL